MQQQPGYKFFITFLLCSLALLLSLFWTYFSAIVLALLIASVFNPCYIKIKRIFKGRKIASSLFMTLFILLVLIIPIGWFVSTLSNEALDFYNTTRNSVSLNKIQASLNKDTPLAQHIRKIANMAGIEFSPETIKDLAGSVGKSIGLFLANQGKSMAQNLFSFLVHFFLMMMTIYYLFRDSSRIKDYVVQHIPVPQKQLEKVVATFQELGRAIIIGNGLSGVVQGVLGGFGFFIFGLNSPFLWGSIIAFMAFLPIIGASIIFLPATAILLLQGNTSAGLGFLIYNISYSAIIEYLIKPRLIGLEMQMNSLLVFVGIIGGIKLFGLLGIIYGPLIITTFMTLAEIYRLEYKP